MSIVTDAPPQPPKLPLGVRVDGTLTNKAIPVAFVLGTIAVFVVFPLGVLAVILNNMGLERVGTDPGRARRLVAWSWGIFAVVDTLVVLALLGWLVNQLAA